jgi:hypothetical protein
MQYIYSNRQIGINNHKHDLWHLIKSMRWKGEDLLMMCRQDIFVALDPAYHPPSPPFPPPSFLPLPNSTFVIAVIDLLIDLDI